MRKILLTLGFLIMNFLCLTIYAQPLLSKNIHNLFDYSLTTHAPTTEAAEDLATELTIYALIVGVYALYWFKQRA